MTARRICLLFLIGVMACGAAHGVTAVDVVRKAQSACARVSYRGTKSVCVMIDGRQVCSQMQVMHLKPDMTRTRYSSPKVVSGVTLLERGCKCWKYSPTRKTWEQLSSTDRLPARCAPEAVLSNYSLSLAPSQKILGRDAYVVVAKPKRAGESVVRLWIDKQCYLALKTQVEKPSGEIVSTTSFTEIAVNPKDIRPSDFAAPVDAKQVAAERPDFSVTKPKYLPKGYRMVGQCCENVGGHPCVHLQYSNGVNTLSLFERRVDPHERPGTGRKRIPGVMTLTHDQVLYTVIGDLPRSELQKILESTR